jgi:hypothetical protein
VPVCVAHTAIEHHPERTYKLFVKRLLNIILVCYGGRVERSLRAARVATFVYFVLDGTLMGMWLVQIPAVEKHVGISHATLGSLLVLLGLGAFIGMQVAGRLALRAGTRLVIPASGVLCGAALVLPGLARDPWALAGALLVLGFGNGCLDVSMNAHAVHVEKAYNRRIMSAFHATFSVGGVIALLPARNLLAPAPTSPAPESTAAERLRNRRRSGVPFPDASGSSPPWRCCACCARALPTTGVLWRRRTSSVPRLPPPRSPTAPTPRP